MEKTCLGRKWLLIFAEKRYKLYGLGRKQKSPCILRKHFQLTSLFLSLPRSGAAANPVTSQGTENVVDCDSFLSSFGSAHQGFSLPFEMSLHLGRQECPAAHRDPRRARTLNLILSASVSFFDLVWGSMISSQSTADPLSVM